MAEAIALCLLKKIDVILSKEDLIQDKALTASLTEVHRSIRRIKGRPDLMQSYLTQADELSNVDKRVAAEWVNRICEVLFDIEYLVELYTCTLADEETASWPHKGFRKVTKIMKPLKHIADQLERYNTILDQLSTETIEYCFDKPKSSSKTLVDDPKLIKSSSVLDIPDDGLFGFDDHKAKLTEWLVECDTNPEMRVITVWGMGGVGKTTLVAHVYKSKSIIEYFKCRAWVSVSQNFNFDDLRRKIISEFDPSASLESKSSRYLEKMLGKFLRHKRCLIILDDVWDPVILRNVTKILISNMKSRIIITTRIRDIHPGTYILELKPLDENEAMALFMRHAYLKQESSDYPPSLETWAEKIVSKCGGLPLAIVSIANYISTKKQTELAWKNAYDLLKSSKDKINIVNTILSRSITNLPYYLRICFLYCGIFPKGYEFKRKRLLRLWLSEGFITESRITRMRDAETYLNRLVDFSIFQVVTKNEYGRAKTLRIHNCIREMILERLHESFYEIWDRKSQRLQDKHNVRCLSIVKLDDEYKLPLNTCKLRTLHLFSKSTIINLPWGNFKLLRVLDLEDSKIRSLPEEMSTLFNLHYLNIRGTHVVELPKGICNLRNLETLDIRSSSLKNMPKGITKLDKLQHLMGFEINGDDIKQIGNLKHLHTLKTINATNTLVRDLGSLMELRTLVIWVSSTQQSVELAAIITKMESLVNLNINMKSENDIHLDGYGLAKLPRGLEKFSLIGSLRMGKLPKCLCYAKHLMYLKLIDSNLKEDPIPTLADSSSKLCYLHLWGCLQSKVVDKLCFPTKSFPYLKTLEMFDLYIKKVEIQEESLVCLERMTLDSCRELKALPKGIENLHNLKELNLRYISDELIFRLLSSKERSKLQHIPVVQGLQSAK